MEFVSMLLVEKREHIYNPKNVITLVTLFGILFWLLYNLSTFLYESQKINAEIDAIRRQNEQNLKLIEEKKARLLYLQTPERIDKEAKLQLNRKQQGENVIVFIKEKMDIVPSDTEKRTIEHVLRSDIPIVDKWKWLFWGKR